MLTWLRCGIGWGTDMDTFKQGNIVICVDETFSVVLWSKDTVRGALQHMAQYVVDDCSDGFVALVSVATGEVVKGEWHVGRFVLVDGVI